MSLLKENSRENAIREWAANFENNILLKPEHLHLRPTTAAQELVETDNALAGNYEMKLLSKCSMVFLRLLKSLCTRYPSERGERTVMKCLNSALMKRFAKGGDSGMPGLVLADVFLAEKLAADVMRRSGSVEPYIGEYQLSLPTGNMTWDRRVEIMEEDKPDWPARDQYATAEQHDEAEGLAEQEWCETWANEIEKAWDCSVHDAVPVHLCEPIPRQSEDKRRLLDYDGYDGSGFDCGGRQIDDYKGPMDWEVDFTFYMMVLSQLCVGDHRLGMELMTNEVRGRLQKGGRLAWVTLVDLKRVISIRSRQLDQENMEE